MIIDIQKQNARRNRRNSLRTYVISAAHRGTNSDGTEWNDWSVTGEVYAVVTSTSPFDALMDYLRSRPDRLPACETLRRGAALDVDHCPHTLTGDEARGACIAPVFLRIVADGRRSLALFDTSRSTSREHQLRLV